MKNVITTTILAMSFTLPLAMADEQHHDDTGDKTHTMEMQSESMAEGGMMDHDAMQERMQAMRQTMQRIRSAEDPDTRKRLMQDHMRQMHAAMGAMKGMGDRHSGMHENMEQSDGQRCRQMMEMHSQMMQGMMEQMEARMQMEKGQSESTN